MPQRATFALFALLALLCVVAPRANADVFAPGSPLSFNPGPGAGAGRSATAGGLRAGGPSAPVTQAEIDAELKASTGLEPSQISTASVCGTPRPGHVGCDAKVLVSATTHRLIHPHIRAEWTFHLHSGDPFTPQAVTTSSAAAEPTPTTPAYIQQAYDLSELSASNGAGVTIGVVDAYNDPNAEADLATWRAHWGLSVCTEANGCFRQLNEAGATSPLPAGDSGWEEEISLDLDAVSTLCPNCHIVLVEANSDSTSDLDAAVSTAANAGATIISNSFSSNNTSPTGEGTSSWPNVSAIFATGDHGYPGAGDDAYPASFPGVTAAGGTSISADASSLRGYSESAWSLASGWGGASGCNLNEPKPSWQTDTGCHGRAYADVSADADPSTGLAVYDSGNGGWLQMGGTSLASPLIAAFEAITGVSGHTAAWAYQDASLLNDPISGSSGNCAADIAYICTAGPGYDGPTGVGSISGDVVNGAPGIGGPTNGSSYAQSVNPSGATLEAGVYPNGLDTTYYWQYGTSTSYGSQTASVDAGAGTVPAAATATLSGLTPETTYHYRLVAVNADGTDYGYDNTLSTDGSSPEVSSDPTISGTATEGGTLTASTGSWTPSSGLSYSYQWERSPDGANQWSNITGATASSYAPGQADVGYDLQVLVTASDAYGNGQAASGPTGPVVSDAPVASGTPTVTGTPATGDTLTVSASFSPSGSDSYVWERSGDGGTTWIAISGATGATYTASQADEGDLLRVSVTATDADGSATATSSAVGPVATNPPVNTQVPTISGTAQRTGTLVATVGTWTGPGLTYAYQWQSSADNGQSWQDISGATGSTHTLGVSDEGLIERVVVSASNVDGIASADSGASQAISAFPPGDQSPPVLSGTAQRSDVLQVTTGTWTGPDNTYSVQWQRNTGEGYFDISGATAATYTIGVADEGSTLRAVVTAANPDGAYEEASAASSVVAAAPPVNTAAPVLAGSPQRGATITANEGGWSGAGNTYAIQWQHSGDDSTWTNIAGATNAGYAITTADEGSYLRAQITATNPDGTATTTSSPTPLIVAVPPVNTLAPSVPAGAARGQTITGNQGTWTGLGNSFTQQWQRSSDGSTWTNITGATALSYTPTLADEGDAVRLLVSATNIDGTVSVASAPTSAITAAAPVDVTPPSLAGTPTRSDTLTAVTGTWNGNLNSYTYAWARSADGTTWTTIPGATAGTYVLTVADEGFDIRATVTGSNPDGSVAVNTPASTAVSAAPPVNTVAPSLSGTAQRGSTLVATQGTWTGIANTYAFSWQRSADGGSTWTTVSSQTSGTYAITQADEGDELRAVLTATNPDGTVSAASAPTAVVAVAAPVCTATPTVSGTASRGDTLTATLGTWTGIANNYDYQWQSSTNGGGTWTDVDHATNSTYPLGIADEGSELRMVITATNVDGTSTVTSAPTAVVAAAPPVNTTTPSVSGSAVRGDTLLGNQGNWSGIANTYTYQWQRNTGSGFVNIAGATALDYGVIAADEGATLRLIVTATNPDGTASLATAATGTVPASPPVLQAAPTVSGQATRGTTLTGSSGSWGGVANTYALQWQRSADSGTTWTNIAGATSSIYTLGFGDEGDEVRLNVTATNADGTLSAASTPTVAVAASAPINTVSPTISGTAVRGSILTAVTGSFSGSGNIYTTAWQRSADGQTWTNIPGATSGSYTLGAGDEHSRIRVTVTATNVDGTASASSPATAIIAGAPPVLTVAPTLAGNPERGSALAVSPGTWSGVNNTYATQWQSSGDGGQTWQNITGATGPSYVLTRSDEGNELRAQITATNADATVAAYSAASSAVLGAAPTVTVAPVITGQPRRAGTLTASPGTWSGAGNTYADQWERSANGGQSWTDIPGATGTDYVPVQSDEGDDLRVQVTATNPDATVSATSAATPAVAAAPPLDSQSATLVGTPKLGASLTAENGTWTPGDVSFTYQWQSGSNGSFANISGATASTYTLTANEVGETVRVIVTGTDPDGSATSTSAASAVVLGPPNSLGTPAVPAGTPEDGDALTADPGSWDTSTVESYQWVRCPVGAVAYTSACASIGTGASYTPTDADVGAPLGVLVTATDTGGSTTVASALTPAISGQPLTNLSAPAISGDPQIPDVLTATPGTWSVALTGTSYSWARCDLNGANCTTVSSNTSIYPLTGADAGHTIVLTATVTSPGRQAAASSLPLAVQNQPLPEATSRPTLSGTTTRGATLTLTPGGWSNSPSQVTYTWQDCNSSGGACTPISGATASTYTLTHADEGHTIVVLATATNATGSATASSAASAVIAASPAGFALAPQIASTGTPTQGVTLTGTPGHLSASTSSDTTVAYAWKRCNNTGSSCTAIAGATSVTYTVSAQDIGTRLMFEEAATNADGTTIADSPLSAAALGTGPRWLTLPVLAHDAGNVGDVLHITPGTWSAPAPSSDTLELERCFQTCADAAALTGANPTYTIVAADAGAILRVRETATNANGASVVWSSAYVGPVGSTAVAAGVPGLAPLALHNSSGQTLAFAQLLTDAQTAIRISGRRAVAPTRTLVIRRAKGLTGSLTAWACQVRPSHPGELPACTAKITITGADRLRLPATLTGAVRVIVERRHPAPARRPRVSSAARR